jgi:hypothetical protein
MKKRYLVSIPIIIAISFVVLNNSNNEKISEIPEKVTTFSSEINEQKKILKMLPILNSEFPLNDFKKIKPFLNQNDILIYNPSNYEKLYPHFPNNTLATGGTSINNLLGNICRVPDNTKIITYDYEPAYTPEYSSDQKEAIEFFSKLKSEANSCGKKLAIAPVFIYTSHWDWNEVSKHTDIIIMQVQNFQTNSNVPQKMKSEELGVNLIQVTKYLVSEIDPETELFLQFGSILGSDSGNDIANDFKIVSGLGIDGVVFWYNPGLSGSTSNLEPLLDALNQID